MKADPRCERSDLPRSMCSHCKGLTDFADNLDDFEIEALFSAKFPGNCAVERSHQIFKYDEISRVARVDNPFLPVTGYACRVCTARLKRKKNER